MTAWRSHLAAACAALILPGCLEKPTAQSQGGEDLQDLRVAEEGQSGDIPLSDTAYDHVRLPEALETRATDKTESSLADPVPDAPALDLDVGSQGDSDSTGLSDAHSDGAGDALPDSFTDTILTDVPGDDTTDASPVDVPPDGPCVPSCSGTECGDDGCGGTCGNCDDSNLCTLDECLSGQCVHVPLGGPCDDGLSCTVDDSCQDGICSGQLAPMDVLVALGCMCAQDEHCAAFDDGDACNGILSCLPAESEGKPLGFSVCMLDVDSLPECDDGLYCNGIETCDPKSGDCIAGPAPLPPGSDKTGCVVLTCDEETDSFVELPSDAACDDNNPCTTDKCQAGKNTCLNYPGQLPCEDGDPCTTGDHCVDAQCQPGSPVTCDDGNDCTIDGECDPVAGCPLVLEPAGAPCGNQSKSECDLPDTCDSQGACLPNLLPTNTQCRPPLEDCDLAEYCTPEGTCPPDQKKPKGSLCGDKSSSTCSAPDTCDDKGTCLPNHKSADTLCRGASGTCDVAEMCDGLGSCPPDGFKPEGTTCGSQTSSTCTSPDTCDGKGVCQPNHASTETVCRADKGQCDVPEQCDGKGTCPTDAFEPAGTTCGSPIDTTCTKPDSCDGKGKCLSNHATNTTPCRPAAGECDVDEMCDGQGSCPADEFMPLGMPCGDPGTTACDNPDYCNGKGQCDTSPAGTNIECRASAGQCDVPEFCDGKGACPKDGFQPNGTSCSDTNGCTGPDVCNDSGVCTTTVLCYKDEIYGLMWEAREEGQSFSLAAYDPAVTGVPLATTYCDNLVRAGYNDWRLPTIDEFRKLTRCNTVQWIGVCPCTQADCTACVQGVLNCTTVCTAMKGLSGGCYWPVEFSPGQCSKGPFWVLKAASCSDYLVFKGEYGGFAKVSIAGAKYQVMCVR